jgi:hypothetical protein
MVTRVFKALAGYPALMVSVSALAHFPDSSRTFPDVREVPILLQKSKIVRR